MKEGTKTAEKAVRKKDIKISFKDYDAIDIYAKSQNSTAVKVINKIIEDFLNQEEVKKIVAENGEVARKRKLLEKKRAELAKLEAEIAEMEVASND